MAPKQALQYPLPPRQPLCPAPGKCPSWSASPQQIESEAQPATTSLQPPQNLTYPLPPRPPPIEEDEPPPFLSIAADEPATIAYAQSPRSPTEPASTGTTKDNKRSGAEPASEGKELKRSKDSGTTSQRPPRRLEGAAAEALAQLFAPDKQRARRQRLAELDSKARAEAPPARGGKRKRDEKSSRARPKQEWEVPGEATWGKTKTRRRRKDRQDGQPEEMQQ